MMELKKKIEELISEDNLCVFSGTHKTHYVKRASLESKTAR